MCLKAGLVTNAWTRLTHLAIWGSIATWFIFVFIYRSVMYCIFLNSQSTNVRTFELIFHVCFSNQAGGELPPKLKTYCINVIRDSLNMSSTLSPALLINIKPDLTHAWFISLSVVYSVTVISKKLERMWKDTL